MRIGFGTIALPNEAVEKLLEGSSKIVLTLPDVQILQGLSVWSKD